MDVVAAAAEDAAWNAERIEHGCPPTWRDIEVGNAGPDRGYAIFQNLDAGRFTDENANRNSNWHTGFPSRMVMYDANIYRNGLPHPWTRENRISAHACGSGYPVTGAMSGTLKNGRTAYWLLRGIPRPC